MLKIWHLSRLSICLEILRNWFHFQFHNNLMLLKRIQYWKLQWISSQHAKVDNAAMSYQNQFCSDTASLLDFTGIEATAHLCWFKGPTSVINNDHILSYVQNFTVDTHPKIWPIWFCHRVMSPKDADRNANSVDSDHCWPRPSKNLGSVQQFIILLSWSQTAQ